MAVANAVGVEGDERGGASSSPQDTVAASGDSKSFSVPSEATDGRRTSEQTALNATSRLE